MELRPFHALRYDCTRVRLADVVAPPYDIIDNRYRDALYSRSPYNVVRLILNRDPDRYTSSAVHLAQWIETGVLCRDAAPALWLYVQNFSHGEAQFERTGVIGAVRLEPFSSGRIRPHERTLSAPKEDRMRLVEACRTNLSPIFGLYANQRPVLDQTRAIAGRVHPAMEVTDEFGVRHRVWRVNEAAATTAITSALSHETVFIADGHHRYETALAYRDRLCAHGDLDANNPANFIMMYLCSMDDPGLLVLPTHRILRGISPFDPADFLAALQHDFDVRIVSPTTGPRQLLTQLARSTVPGSFGVALSGTDVRYEISPRANKRPGFPEGESVIDRLAPDLPPVVRHLDVTILDRVILRGILGVDADTAARSGQLSYSHDGANALDRIAAGDAQVAFLLKPPDLAEVQAVCLSGETMPQKSTYFYPKLLTGMLFHPLTRAVGASEPAVRCAEAR